MSGYLFDTDVLSLLSPGRPDVPEGFEAWVEAQDRAGQIYLSAVSIHEIEKGIRRLEAKGHVQRVRALEAWVRPLVTRLGNFILPVDAEVARVSGALEAKAIAEGANPGGFGRDDCRDCGVPRVDRGDAESAAFSGVWD